MQGIRSRGLRGHRFLIAVSAISFLMAALQPRALLAQAQAGTLDRIRLSSRLTIGYLADAGPFSYRDKSGKAAGYSVTLCQKIADQVKAELKLSTLNVQWVPVAEDGRFSELQQGRVDLLCGADTETLERRKTVAFSIPIFPGGISALVRSDSSHRLREILTKGQAAPRPLWRATPAQVLEQQIFSVVKDTTSEKWLAGVIDKFQVSVKIVPVSTHEEGIRRVFDRSANVFFGERAILLDAGKSKPSGRDLLVLDRRFTHERLALTLMRGDDDFRLLVDRTLSRIFRSPDFIYLYSKWFGDPDEATRDFFRLSALPE